MFDPKVAIIKSVISHKDKVLGITTNGYLAEWDTIERRWVLCGKTNEVYKPEGFSKKETITANIIICLAVILAIVGLFKFMRS